MMDEHRLTEHLTVLIAATEWDSAHGGLSTFNRELCKAIAELGHKVYCLVYAAADAEVLAAARYGVELIVPPRVGGLSDDARLSLSGTLPSSVVPDVIVGHGSVTGGVAVALERMYGATPRIHFVHVAPGAIEWFKPQHADPAAVAEERDEREASLARNATLVAAVGPLLKREIEHQLSPHGIKAYEFRPGLGPVRGQVSQSAIRQCLVLGRAEDWLLKGLDIAARAFANASHSLDDILLIRGAPAKEGAALRQQLQTLVKRPDLDIRVRPYASRAERIADDLARSCVLLMPSRSEGFGLVGLEAISAGVPVLLSERSGLAMMLRDLLDDEANEHILPVTMDPDADGDSWGRKLRWIFQNREQALERVLRLRDRLQGLVSWRDSTGGLLVALAGKSRISQRQASSIASEGGGAVLPSPTAQRVVRFPRERAPDWPADRTMPDVSIGDLRTIHSWNWTSLKLQSVLYELDYATMEGIDDQHAGVAEQWNLVFADHPDTWRFLYTRPGHIIGYWHFVPLLPDQYDQAKDGTLLDINITADRVRVFELPGIYNIYFAGICLLAEYRRASCFRPLISSLLQVFLDLAREDVFIGEICANAITATGESLCNTLGMLPYKKHESHGTVYVGRLRDILRNQVANRFPELRALYNVDDRDRSA